MKPNFWALSQMEGGEDKILNIGQKVKNWNQWSQFKRLLYFAMISIYEKKEYTWKRAFCFSLFLKYFIVLKFWSEQLSYGGILYSICICCQFTDVWRHSLKDGGLKEKKNSSKHLYSQYLGRWSRKVLSSRPPWVHSKILSQKKKNHCCKDVAQHREEAEMKVAMICKRKVSCIWRCNPEIKENFVTELQ